jgi:uncharacterized phage-associated protein
MTVSARDAARYLTKISGNQISNLQIQKMLYLADMNFVGQGQGRLISEDFEAWDYGPVLPSLYHSLKAFGAKPVPDVFWGASDISGTAEAVILDRAWKSLRHQSAGQLVENTHWVGGAWAKKYLNGVKGIKISTADMQDEYFKRQQSIART